MLAAGRRRLVHPVRRGVLAQQGGGLLSWQVREESINAIQIRPGILLQYQGRMLEVRKASHVKPGKGGAFMQVEMKDINDGTKLNNRFRSSEAVERVELDPGVQFNLLYVQDERMHLMHPETYEQVELPLDMLGEQAGFLKEGLPITVENWEGKPIRASLPNKVDFVVKECDPPASLNSFKPAVLDVGVKVQVPQFVKQGDEITVDVRDGTYVGRVR